MYEPKEDLVLNMFKLFCKKMTDWEKETYEIYQKNDDIEHKKDIIKNNLREIYNEFLTKKERKTGRIASLSAGETPEFDLLTIEFGNVFIEDKKAIIFYSKKESDYYSNNYRVTFLKKEGSFLIDKMERYSSYNDKWVNVVL